MRFMIMVRATPDTEAGVIPADDTVMTAMEVYHEELAKAGVLLDAAGLQPSAKGWRIRYGEGRRTVMAGPHAETRELIAAYTLIQTRSREEAMEWARRFPAPMDALAEGEIEVRQLCDREDSVPAGKAGSPAEQRGRLQAAAS